VWTEQKQIEKLRYMHRNPVKRGLVDRPEQWEWSSFRSYLFGETGPVRVRSQEWPLEIKARPVATFGEENAASLPVIRGGPLIRKERE
jgi:putative transposase